MNKKNKKSCSADILTQQIANPETITNKFNEFFVNFLDEDLLAETSMLKRSGLNTQKIIENILELRLNRISIGTNAVALAIDGVCNKDAYYNLLKRDQNDVLRLTTKLAKKIDSAIAPEPAPEADLENGFFIIDDTTYERLYSKETELASPQFDHNTKEYYIGYRKNQLGFYRNGNYLPVNSVLVSTTDQKKAISPAKTVKSAVGQEKRRLTQSKMTDVSLFQIDLAQQAGFKAAYVLFDSWYTSAKMFSELLDRGLYGIGRVKDCQKVKFMYHSEKMTLKEIFRENKYNPQQLQEDHFYFSVLVDAEYNGKRFPVRLYFFTHNSADKEFYCIGTTDTTLSYELVHKLFKIRWSTENYFADTKDIHSMMSNKQCQCQSLDSIYFDAAITVILYLFLAWLLKDLNQECSLKRLFHKAATDLQALKNYSLLLEILKHLIGAFSAQFDHSEEELMAFVSESLINFETFYEFFLRVNSSSCLVHAIDPPLIQERKI